MNRVAITGMGAISPIGCDIESVFQSLSGGVSGIGGITRFDLDGMKVSVAAEVRDFDPERFGMRRGEWWRMDLYT